MDYFALIFGITITFILMFKINIFYTYNYILEYKTLENWKTNYYYWVPVVFLVI